MGVSNDSEEEYDKAVVNDDDIVSINDDDAGKDQDQ